MAIKVPICGHVVKEYKIGDTTIKICDDAYRDKTPEELEKTWERITAVCWKIVLAERAKGKDI
jgi:hypothetical protein